MKKNPFLWSFAAVHMPPIFYHWWIFIDEPKPKHDKIIFYLILYIFSILTAISEGKNTRAEIENLLKKEIGGYLTKMERDFNLIKKQQPIFTKSSTKNVKYQIEDNFIMFGLGSSINIHQW